MSRILLLSDAYKCLEKTVSKLKLTPLATTSQKMAVTKSQHSGGQKGDTATVADVRHLKSPLEINLIRLMHKCEQRALDGSAEVATDWRQHTYIACLRDFLKKLQGIVFEKL